MERIEWGSYSCGCGRSAGHLGGDLRSLISAETEEQARGVGLFGHVEYGGVISEVAPCAVSVIVSALGESLHSVARLKMLETVLASLSGEETEWVDGIPVGSCSRIVYSGLRTFYQEAVSGESEIALDILELVEGDIERLEYFRNFVIDNPVKKRGRRGRG
ncbi:hypothetical protein OU787_03685 [Kitasatospora sp. YST-16]|uniref:hypothetical protein n=1 Tax=Kitasatospora sp. YST-16 TaxID=2998080 RepID=UPI00228500C2|nr:hypothetical protein [Kitasatospora sp. YST-16]WAL70673.1 hypothetical protein OU787_03685 [Kitasatospora sp. YST-16]WNW36716.1 hypothetical protein RKE32_03675 [Streptomyces sp. Li-HN-5-13]